MNLNINPNFNKTQNKNGVHKNTSKQDIAFGEKYCMIIPKILGTATSSKTGETARTNFADFVLVQFAKILRKRPELEFNNKLQTLAANIKAVVAKNIVAISDTNGDDVHKLYFFTNSDAKNIISTTPRKNWENIKTATKTIKDENILTPKTDAPEIVDFFSKKIIANIGIIEKTEHKFLPDLMQLNSLKNSDSILDNFHFGPITKSNGILKQIENHKYPLGDNEGIFHSIKDNNIGYFTDAKDENKIIGVIIPTKEGNALRFMRKNGEVTDAFNNNIDGSYKQVIIDKNGKARQLYEYANGKGKYTDL